MEPGRSGLLRSVALPTEHGGWGFTLEAVLLGLLVAPAPAGAGIAVAALAAFLARRPLRLLVADRQQGRRLPRTALARGILAGCLIAAAAGLAAAASLARGPFWWPLLAALPLAAFQVGADLARRGRWFLSEAAAAVAMGAVAPAIALAHGGEAVPAFGLWAVLAARDLPSILLVRAQIRRGRGQPARPAPAYAAHAVALGSLAALAARGVVPGAAALAAALLWTWALASLARPPLPARALGWTQVLAGLLVVGCTAAGHHLGL